MVGKTYTLFSRFWSKISRAVTSSNCPTYHSCCKVWVSRFKQEMRDSHLTKQSWRDALKSLQSTATDTKGRLHAHMKEFGWGEPIKWNYACQRAPIPHTTAKSQLCKELSPTNPEQETATNFQQHSSQLHLAERGFGAPVAPVFLHAPLSNRPLVVSEGSFKTANLDAM